MTVLSLLPLLLQLLPETLRLNRLRVEKQEEMLRINNKVRNLIIIIILENSPSQKPPPRQKLLPTSRRMKIHSSNSQIIITNNNNKIPQQRWLENLAKS